MQPVLTRCGVRTESQIEAEKDAIRGILKRRAADAQPEAKE